MQLNRSCRNEKENLLRFFFSCPLDEESPCSVFEGTKIAITHIEIVKTSLKVFLTKGYEASNIFIKDMKKTYRMVCIFKIISALQDFLLLLGFILWLAARYLKKQV